MVKRTAKKKSAAKKKPVAKRKTSVSRKISEKDVTVVCFNRDCKLRKKKSCRGFEGCPGFQGK